MDGWMDGEWVGIWPLVISLCGPARGTRSRRVSVARTRLGPVTTGWCSLICKSAALRDAGALGRRGWCVSHVRDVADATEHTHTNVVSHITSCSGWLTHPLDEVASMNG